MKECQIIIPFSFSDIQLMLSEVIREFYDLYQISIRDLIKKQLMKEGDENSIAMRQVLSRGELLPQILIDTLIANEIAKSGKGLLIIDYPRTVEQYLALKHVLRNAEREITKAWVLKPEEGSSVIDSPRSKAPRDMMDYLTKDKLTPHVFEFSFSSGSGHDRSREEFCKINCQTMKKDIIVNGNNFGFGYDENLHMWRVLENAHIIDGSVIDIEIDLRMMI